MLVINQIINGLSRNVFVNMRFVNRLINLLPHIAPLNFQRRPQIPVNAWVAYLLLFLWTSPLWHKKSKDVKYSLGLETQFQSELLLQEKNVTERAIAGLSPEPTERHYFPSLRSI